MARTKTDKYIPNKGRGVRLFRYTETAATCGLILIAVALGVPFLNLAEGNPADILKWIYAAGALVYTVARVVESARAQGSVRMRRLYRMEFWAGVSFMLAAAFWFYNSSRFEMIHTGILTLLRNTVLFTLVGAFIQIIASWLIVAQSKKEAGNE